MDEIAVTFNNKRSFKVKSKRSSSSMSVTDYDATADAYLPYNAFRLQIKQFTWIKLRCKRAPTSVTVNKGQRIDKTIRRTIKAH